MNDYKKLVMTLVYCAHSMEHEFDALQAKYDALVSAARAVVSSFDNGIVDSDDVCRLEELLP